MINGQYIVLSFKEWNNWISQGLLKIHSFRIQPCQNSKHSFFNLMNTAADITHLDDNEYILAKLSKSYSSSILFSLKYIDSVCYKFNSLQLFHYICR